MFVFPMIIRSFFIHKMALTATALCRFLCLKNSVIPGVLFGFEQIHSFLFKLKIYMRLLYTKPDGYTYISIALGGRSMHALQAKLFVLWIWRPLSLSNALKSSSTRHCLRAQLPSSAESLQNAAMMQFQRIWPTLMATGKISCKCQCATLNRTLLLIGEVPRHHMN